MAPFLTANDTEGDEDEARRFAGKLAESLPKAESGYNVEPVRREIRAAAAALHRRKCRHDYWLGYANFVAAYFDSEDEDERQELLGRLSKYRRLLPIVADVQKFRDELIAESERAAELREQWQGRPPQTTRQKRKRRQTNAPKKLTSRQLEASTLYGECKGVIAEVARRMGVDQSTARQHVNAAFGKLGKAVPGKHRTQSIKLNRRGQENVTDADDVRRSRGY